MNATERRLVQRIRQLEAALLPFAKAAGDYEPPTSKHYDDREHVALSLTAGHLRQARRVLLAKESISEIGSAREEREDYERD